MIVAPKKSSSLSRVTLHHMMTPAHANALGNVHGGVIMRLVDECGAISAMRHAHRPCVTIAIDSMTFREPVHVGALLMCEARVTYVGRTSIETSIRVHAENPVTGETTHTNSAFVVYVALGEDGRPSLVPELDLQTEADRIEFAEGEARQRHRIAHSPR
jgi:uncharacterized protein (TIGR00369 family)